jgi:uroporphyrinogen decarboxylase
VDFTRENRDKFIKGGFLRVFERMQWLRGMAALMLDLMDDRSEVYRLRDMVHEMNMCELGNWLAHDLDAVVFSDDWGSQRQLLIPPPIWRSFFAPCYEEMFSRTHEVGKLVFFHSDGYILEIIEDLIALGVDALNSQVWCMGVEELGRRFRGRLCFWGELDRQHTLPRGTPADIQSSARHMKLHLEAVAGGLIGQGEAGVDVPLVNIEAMLSCWD